MEAVDAEKPNLQSRGLFTIALVTCASPVRHRAQVATVEHPLRIPSRVHRAESFVLARKIRVYSLVSGVGRVLRVNGGRRSNLWRIRWRRVPLVGRYILCVHTLRSVCVAACVFSLVRARARAFTHRHTGTHTCQRSGRRW